MITLISTTYHTRTTWLFVYPSLQDTIPYAVNLSLTLLKMGKNCPKHVELIFEINKLLLLHLVGFYLHWWCTVKHKSSLYFFFFTLQYSTQTVILLGIYIHHVVLLIANFLCWGCSIKCNLTSQLNKQYNISNQPFIWHTYVHTILI